MDEGAGEEAPRRRIGKGWRIGLISAALVSVLLSLVNASWIAAQPPGRLIVVARHGIVQQVAAGSGCEAKRMQADPQNDYVENTLPAIYKAAKLGADAIEIDVQATADGQAVAFRDADLSCRTNGTGPLSAHSLADLKRLDVGYGYTGDGGHSYPLRGRGVGGVPTVEEVLHEVPNTQIVFRFLGRDPAVADALVAALKRAGATGPERFAFEGDGAVTARVAQLLPGAWSFPEHPAGPCIADYVRVGWTSYVPASCRGATIALTVGERWKLWGWPYRFLGRMAAADARVLMYGEEKDGALVGITDVAQYDKVPAGFRGYLFVEDFYTVGAALRR
ncbi:MAG TPA: glycerophosphodiester phosphodiesterase family protein [Allosphingosinicella sp.]|nr:glycerophosphodiester phosphodiesterase family protein [Allosphingosinicella sp.]